MRLDPEIKRKLQSIFGREGVLLSKIDRIAYGYDGTRMIYPADAVVRVTKTEQVVELMILAAECNFPVIPRGAATNLTGGSLPLFGGVAVDFSLMNKILSIDPENLTAVVEPGVVVSYLQEEVEKKGLFYPLDPASNEFSTIGGNIAEGAGGIRGLKYGVTRDYVLALEAVLPDGTIIRTGAQTMKSVVGYDLTRLLVGSEGTLAIITQATLKLLPKPQSAGTARVIFSSDTDALKAASFIVANGLLPRALEFIDCNCLAIIREVEGEIEAKEGQAMLIVEFDGTSAAVNEKLAALQRLMASKAYRFDSTTDTLKRRELWMLRKSISPSIYKITDKKISEDICVPRSQLAAILIELKRIGKEFGIRTLAYGHSGDGNLHVNFLLDDTEPETEEVAQKAVAELFRSTIRLGGTLSGEHGIGITKKAYLGLEVSEAEMGLMRGIKSLFDPKGILNPGKILPEKIQ